MKSQNNAHKKGEENNFALPASNLKKVELTINSLKNKKSEDLDGISENIIINS